MFPGNTYFIRIARILQNRLDNHVIARFDGEIERRETVGVVCGHVDRAFFAPFHQFFHRFVVAFLDGGVQRLLRVFFFPVDVEKRPIC